MFRILLILSIIFLVGSLLPGIELLSNLSVNKFSDLIVLGFFGAGASIGYIFLKVEKDLRKKFKIILVLNIITIVVYAITFLMVLIALQFYPLQF